jgi:hypothetical protein
VSSSEAPPEIADETDLVVEGPEEFRALLSELAA